MPRSAEDRLGPGGVASRLIGLLVGATVMGVLVAGLVVPFAVLAGAGSQAVAEGLDDLPAKLTPEPLAQRTRVLDRHGNLLTTLYAENRVVVPLKKVAPVMRKALVSIEDQRFYEHGAIDLRGTMRALVQNQRAGSSVQGGSTITQQLVKLTLLDQADNKKEAAAATAQTYRRKFRELRYAMALEKEYSKRWILRRYLNLAYFGDGAYGIEAAAQHYFSRPASKLRLRHAALLAGLVKNPTSFDPTNYPDRALNRRNVVLNRMAELGEISQARANKVKKRGLGLDVTRTSNGCVSSTAPFFCQYVREYLLRDKALGKNVKERRQLLRAGGLTIKTTLAPGMQRAAENSVERHVDPTDPAVGALALVEPGTGAVRAVAQSRPMGAKKKQGQTFLNYVVPRKYGDATGFQAGSTFKPFVLAAAIDRGIPLETRIRAPQEVELRVDRFRGCSGRLRSDDVWNPANSTGSGVFDLYTGTQQSVNTFFAKLELRTGLCRPYRLAKRMGLRLNDPDNQQVPSFTLGVTDTDPLTMAEAYATFAARGVHCDPRPVAWVRGPDGKIIKRYKNQCDRVLRKPVADAVNDVLRGVQEPGGFGYNAGLGLGQPSAGKTGTTNRSSAVWFVGYTPNMAGAAVIAGVDGQGRWKSLNGRTIGGRYIAQASGSGNAGPIWGDAMQVVQRWLKDRNFVPPPPRMVRGTGVTVPDVVGLDGETAAGRLRESGLRVEFADPVPSSQPFGTVADLEPAAGSQVGSGQLVTLTPSLG